MNKSLRHILLAFLLCCSAAVSIAAPRTWESVKQEYSVGARPVLRSEEIEVRTYPGIIVVTTVHPVPIRVFTILGRLVSADTLPQGSSRLVLPASGVYIVKVGDQTCKVAV